MAVKYAREQGARTLSICNTQGSTIPRESDAVLYTHAGPEVAVASTKAFVAQVTALYLLGLYLAQRRGTLDAAQVAEQVTELQNMPDKLDQVVESASSRIAELAHWMGDTQSVLFLGRHVGYPVALEGALKLKELAYIHAEGFAAGELKHGPIALIEPGQIVFVIVPRPRDPTSLHPKVVSNIQEIRARGARVIAIAEIGDVAVVPFADEVIRIPLAAPLFEPLLAVVPLHIFGDGAGDGEGPRRRPAAQPGEVGHGRVTAGRVRSARMAIWQSRASASTWSTWRGSSAPSPARPRCASACSLRANATCRCARSPAGSPPKRRFMKALGESTGVQLARHGDRARRPWATRRSCVSGGAAELVAAKGIIAIHLSMSHDAGVAVASVVCETA